MYRTYRLQTYEVSGRVMRFLSFSENLIEVQTRIVLLALHRVQQEVVGFFDLDEVLLYLNDHQYI